MAESEASHGFPEGWRCPCLIFVALKQSQMAQRPTAQRQHGRALALPTGDGSGGAALEAPAGSCAMLQDRARGDLASKLENLSASGACRVYSLDPRWSRRAFRILAGGFLMAAASRRRPQTRRRDADPRSASESVGRSRPAAGPVRHNVTVENRACHAARSRNSGSGTAPNHSCPA